MTNKDDSFQKILDAKYNFLFMSATPRIYELEDEIECNDFDLNEPTYKITFKEAIEKKYITDYKIFIPSIHENNDDLLNDIRLHKHSLIFQYCRGVVGRLIQEEVRKNDFKKRSPIDLSRPTIV